MILPLRHEFSKRFLRKIINGPIDIKAFDQSSVRNVSISTIFVKIFLRIKTVVPI